MGKSKRAGVSGAKECEQHPALVGLYLHRPGIDGTFAVQRVLGAP